MTRLEKSGLAEKELASSVLSLTGCCSIQIRVHTKNCNHFSTEGLFKDHLLGVIISQILQKCTFPVYSNKAFKA